MGVSHPKQVPFLEQTDSLSFVENQIALARRHVLHVHHLRIVAKHPLLALFILVHRNVVTKVRLASAVETGRSKSVLL